MKMQHTKTTSAFIAVILAGGLGSKLQAAPLTAVQPGNNGATPRIQFAAPNYDFGKVVAGATAKHTFVFMNTGKALLKITEVRPSCGCTTAGAWSQQVKPGKTGSIPIAFHASNFGTSFFKTITVTCNDPVHRVTRLEIKGTIWKPIAAIPATAVFKIPANTSSNITTTVRLINHSDHPVALSDPESNNHAFAAELKTVHPGKEYQLIVKAIPSFAVNYMRGVITLKTSLRDMPTINVPVFVLHPQARRFPVQTAKFPPTKHLSLNSVNPSVGANGVKH